MDRVSRKVANRFLKKAEKDPKAFEADLRKAAQDYWRALGKAKSANSGIYDVLTKMQSEGMTPSKKTRKALDDLHGLHMRLLKEARSFPVEVESRNKTAAWENLPKGWTQESLNKMWESMTGDRKHKVTACIKKMGGKVDDPGAFCASLADKMEPGWRSKEAVSRPAAKGNPAYEALSDAWDLFETFKDDVDDAIMEMEVSDEVSINRAASLANKQHRSMIKGAKPWAYAFNTLLEGREVDTSRMVQDLASTVKDIDLMRRRLNEALRKFPLDDYYFNKALRSGSAASAAFEKAIKLFKKI